MKFLRYPGGKSKLLSFLITVILERNQIRRYIEPFVGGGSVFLHLQPEEAILADINRELIELYKGIRNYPHKVWETFASFPSDKEAYYRIRNDEYYTKPLFYRAARTLYLNRTCFKGMWRHNAQGQFNVGYGGQSRRWVIDETSLLEVSNRLRNADLLCSDFQPVIDNCRSDDFIFVDPPYRPRERELLHSHYLYNKFSFAEHQRLASVLHQASQKDIKWVLTISSHPDIIALYRENRVITLSKGTGRRPGILTDNPGEVLICNYHSEVAE